MYIENICHYCHKRPINKSRSISKCGVCLDRAKDSVRKYYQSHKEKVLSYQSSYYQSNSESIKEYSRKHGKNLRKNRIENGICGNCGEKPIDFSRSKSSCSSCLDKAKGFGNKYRQNPELKAKIKESQKKSDKPELARVRREKYRKKNKNRWVEYINRRRAKKTGAGGKISKLDWLIITLIYGSNCLCCKTSENIERDHIVPIDKNGENTIYNIQPLCKTCNRRKWNKTIDYRPFLLTPEMLAVAKLRIESKINSKEPILWTKNLLTETEFTSD